MTLTWETEADWNNGVSESRVFHDSTLKMKPVTSFEDYTDGEDIGNGDAWTQRDGSINVFTDSAQAYDGSISLYGHSEGGAAQADGWDGEPYEDFTFWYRETQSNSGMGVEILNLNNNKIVAVGTDNPQCEIYTGTNGLEQIDEGAYDTWQYYNVSFDWANENVTIDWNGQTTVDRSMVNASAGVGQFIYGDDGHITGVDWQSWNDGWFDLCAGEYTTGSYTTGTKSFSQPEKPNLDSLDYNLNSQSVTLTVIGSPGTASEETNSVTLDGSNAYDLSWNNAHTDFRIKVDFSTTSGTTTPYIWRLRLQETAQVSGTVTLNGNPVSGATVYLIDETNNTLSSKTTASDGTYTFYVDPGLTVHVAVQYDDGNGNQYNDYSKPFVTT